MLRGVCAAADAPVAGLRMEVDGRLIYDGLMNDFRGDVLDLFPAARKHPSPCGFNHSVDLPADLPPGRHTFSFRAVLADGRAMPVGTHTLDVSADGGDVSNPFPDGHFYSPVANIQELVRDRDRVWPAEPEIVGIDFKPAEQRAFLDRFPALLADYDYPLDLPAGAPGYTFRRNNPVFPESDARTLYAVLRLFRPRRMIEIGCGFSSLLVADVNRRHLGGALDFTCVEPYPRPFLREPVPGSGRVIEARVQDVPLAEFATLGAGDVLSVDSSHVAETGCDVNYEFFAVIPRLRPGVLIHVHDIHLPYDYPADTVLGQKRSWDEQYILRALLTHTDRYDVVFGVAYARHHFRDRFRAVVGPHADGGSFWFRKVK